jgi:penicillin-insensitive murein endopeptidase
MLLGVLVWALAGATAGTRPIDEARVGSLFGKPPGSLAIGGTNDGHLERARLLPTEGPGYRVFGHVRKNRTHHGTDELVTLIQDAARGVAERYPGALLGIGNLAAAEGGQVGSSVSHKNGRDADLGFYALDPATGRPEALPGLVSFRPDLRSMDGRYEFDLPRNLELCTSLLSHPLSRIQWIFVAQWLKEPLLAQAGREGRDPALIARLDEVLKQPSDSNPHQHHFHLRLACTIQDRLHGCLDREPWRAWIDYGQAAYEARVAALAELLAAGRPGWRVQAIEALAGIRAGSAAPAIGRALLDPDRRVRTAALDALTTLAVPESVPGLIDALAGAPDQGWALEVAQALLAHETPAATAFWIGFLRDPAPHLPPKLRAGAPDRWLAIAARALAVTRSEAALEALVAGLERATSPAVRQAIHDALRELTNQVAPARLSSATAFRKAVAHWRRFLAESGRVTWLEWMRTGFVARGLPLGAGPLDLGTAPNLIGAVGHPDRIVSHNAVRALGALTSDPVDPRVRTRRNNSRYWASWWRLQVVGQVPPPGSVP